ncbi:DUF1389 domain-containing protein [Chlamydiifrater phoenicopteri]|uniref:DUF1389 domain-containing protein n=1 Tax=Chlamydiifrater phoenicopteri TaxID=2681469 RepID=UPI001BCCF99E|nr:DUF1389 domain-containing protein [Chlamydiifrater phoenicopteri]
MKLEPFFYKSSSEVFKNSNSSPVLMTPYRKSKTYEEVCGLVLGIMFSTLFLLAGVIMFSELSTFGFFLLSLSIIFSGLLFACSRICMTSDSDRIGSKFLGPQKNIRRFPREELSFERVNLSSLIRGLRRGDDFCETNKTKEYVKEGLLLDSQGAKDVFYKRVAFHKKKLLEETASLSTEKAMEGMTASPTSSPGFLTEVVCSINTVPAFKKFIFQKNLVVEEVLELLCNTHHFSTKSENFLRKHLTSSLYEKVLLYGVDSLKREACLRLPYTTPFSFSDFSLENHCPFYFLSEFLKIGLTEEALFDLQSPHKLGEELSLATIAAYSVSRLGLSVKGDNIFSRKYWILSHCIKLYGTVYNKMQESCFSKDWSGFFNQANLLCSVFDNSLSKELEMDGLGVSPGDLSPEDFILLCEHGISFEGICLLSTLRIEYLDMLSDLSNRDGRNILADWMLSFGEKMFFVSGKNKLYRSRLLEVFFNQILLNQKTFNRTLKGSKKSLQVKSIRGITWKELRILGWKWSADRVASFISRLEGEEIYIRNCEEQRWYASVRFYSGQCR